MEKDKHCCPGDAGSLIANRKSEHYLLVSRLSHHIAQRLPFVLYGQFGIESAWNLLLQEFAGFVGLDISTLIITAAFNSAGNLVITYRSGASVDKIIISSVGFLSYFEIINRLKQIGYRSRFCNYSSGNVASFNLAGQLGNDLYLTWNDGESGTTKKDWIRPNACRLTSDAQDDRVGLYLRNIKIDPYMAAVLSFENEVNTLEFDFMMSEIIKK